MQRRSPRLSNACPRLSNAWKIDKLLAMCRQQLFAENSTATCRQQRIAENSDALFDLRMEHEPKMLQLIENLPLKYLNWQQANGRTALHEASATGKHKIVKALLAKGVDEFLVERDEWTAFDLACLNSHSIVVSVFMTGQPEYTNVIFAACIRLRLRTVTALMNRGSVYDAGDDYSKLALSRICRNSSNSEDSSAWEMAEFMIAWLCADVNYLRDVPSETHIFTETHLHAACRNNNTAIAEILLKYGADVTIGSNADGESPFWWACHHNNLFLARRIIHHKSVALCRTGRKRQGLSYGALRLITDPAERVALEHYAKGEPKWIRRKAFAYFLNSIKELPITTVLAKVLGVIELKRTIGSFL